MSLLCAVALLAGVHCGEPAPLCSAGHPVRRRPDVTYGGVRGRRGYQRDHVVPLGLGGPDIAANVHYQRCDVFGSFGRCLAGPAALKDADEDDAIEMMCSGRWSPQQAREWLRARWPLDATHGYELE